MTNPQNQAQHEHTRLEVNINGESHQTLADSMSTSGTTATEAVRRAIGLLGFMYDKADQGASFRIVDADGRTRGFTVV